MSGDAFAQLLDVLGREPDEILSVCHQEPGGRFTGALTTVADAPEAAGRFFGRACVWYGTGALRAGITSGRGTAADVIGVRELYADLDVGAPKLPGFAAALAVIDDLSAMLGATPAAVIMSGHGVQPHWALERGEATDWPDSADPRHATAAELWRRWQALVSRVSLAHGGVVDGIPDLSRVLRVPGSTNLKDPARPVDVTFSFPGGGLVSLDALRECVDAHNEAPAAGQAPGVRTLDLTPDRGPGVPGVGTPITSGHDAALRDYAASVVARYPGAPLEELVSMVVRRGQDCVPSWASGMKPGDQTLEQAARERWLPSAIKKFARPAGPANGSAAGAGTVAHEPGRARRVVATPADSRTMRAARWLWEEGGEQWVPLGGLVLLGGREGIGKSTWGYRIAAQVTRGTLPGDMFGRPRGVAICATEDSWEHTVLPRLAAAGADLSRMYELTAVDGEVTSGVTLPVDVAEVTAVCEQHDVGLLLLDPLLGTISGRLDTHKDAEVRQALEPLSRLAHNSEATVIGLIHQNKGQGSDLLTRLMGSRAFAAVARAVLVCAEEKSELQESDFGDSLDLGKGTRRTFLFGQEKNNLGRRVEHSLKYAIEGTRVGHDAELDKDVWSSRVDVIGTSSERVGEMVERQERDSQPGRGRPSEARDAAKAWLRDYLTAVGAPVAGAEVARLGLIAGHSKATLGRAANELGVLQPRLPDGTTSWSLRRAG